MSVSDTRTWRSRTGRVSLRWHRRTAIVTLVLLCTLIPLGIGVMTTGSFPIDWSSLTAALGGDGDPRVVRVLQSIRLPRLVGGLVVGAALGLSGAVFQTISRNPLGSPDVIGFVTGSATGAIVAILVLAAPPGLVAGCAVAGGVITALVVAALSTGRRGSEGSAGGYRLILVGIGIGALLGAVNDLLLTRGQRDDAIAAQIWLVGTLNSRGWAEVLPAVIAVAVLLPALLIGSRWLTALELGDDMARQTGVPVGAVRLGSMAVAVALVAFATATAGPISFVALAAPQLAARLARSASLPPAASAAMGAVLLVAADLLSQHLPFSLSAPVGLVTGVLGGVYLIWLLTRGRR